MSRAPRMTVEMHPPEGGYLGRQIALTAKRVREWGDRVFTEHGASLVTWIVLEHALRAEPPGFSQRELAEGLSIGGPALVRHIDRLEEAGLVRREPDPHDRRITRITITPEGRRKHEALAAVAARLDEDLASVLSDRERRVVVDALARIERHVACRNAGSAPGRGAETP